MPHSTKEFAATYAKMSDDELTRLYPDRDTLLPEALFAFDSECGKRHLGYWRHYKQPPVTNSVSKKRGVALSANVMNEILRMTWGQRIFWLLCLCAVAFYATHSYRQHEQEVAQQEASKAKVAANMADFQSAIARIESSWQAEDSWENGLSGGDASITPYTVNFEHALVTGHPLIFYGNVIDVHSNEGQDNSTIVVKVHGRKSAVRLQLSLNASPQQTEAITRNGAFGLAYGFDELSKVCVFVASIDNVERVEASDKQGDDASYFVAQGTLHDAYASRVYGTEFFSLKRSELSR